MTFQKQSLLQMMCIEIFLALMTAVIFKNDEGTKVSL